MQTKEDRALSKAKIQLMQLPNTVFYTTILLSLKYQWTDKIQTAATNGIELIINPIYFLGLTEAERVGLLVHEVSHVALNHMTRVGNRVHNIWNQAGDHIINLSMDDAKQYTLPKGALRDPRFHGMNTESVYKIIFNETDKTEYKNVIVPGGVDIIKPKNITQQAKIERTITSIILRADIQSRAAHGSPGTIAGEVAIELQKVVNPKLPWNIILQNYLTNFADEDYSWSKPDEFYLPEFYLPSAYSEHIENFAIAIDSSGSAIPTFNSVITEIATIQEVLKPKKITIIDFDTKVNNIQILTPDTDIFKDLKFTGQGGTQIKPVFKWAIENNPIVLLIFTDGEFNMPDEEYYPTCPIIWLINENPEFTVEIGEVIHYDIDT